MYFYISGKEYWLMLYITWCHSDKKPFMILIPFIFMINLYGQSFIPYNIYSYYNGYWLMFLSCFIVMVRPMIKCIVMVMIMIIVMIMVNVYGYCYRLWLWLWLWL